jgi:uncharacterized protein
MQAHTVLEHQPVIARLEDFDVHSGSRAERLLFNNRAALVVASVVLTVLFTLLALQLKLNASFEKTIPASHPYIVNYLANKANLAGGSNAIRIAVETSQDTIFSKRYLEVLRQINDEVYLMPGVDRPFMKSLWTPNTRWYAVTEEGLDGNTVMTDNYDGSDAALQEVRANVQRSGEVGQIVAADFKSTIIFVPLLEKDPKTGEPLDYRALSQQLEQLRGKYERDGITLHVVGFAKVMGDLIDGMRQVLAFFAVASLICTAVLYVYTRCVRSTFLVVACSIIAVVWQLGLLAFAGFELDPYSILVPFLVFAIGMSHGAQKMNGITQDIGRGTHRVVAARYTFRRLFVAGLTALLCDAVGFAVLMLIQIRVIQNLAIAASIGVAVLIFTNLVLLPILLSYVGVSSRAAERSMRPNTNGSQATGATGQRVWLWRQLDHFTRRGPAIAAVAAGLVLGAGAYAVSLHLKIGDLDPGAPELRPDSRYNRDDAFVVKNYAASSDVLVVMVATPEDKCTRYETLALVGKLSGQLDQLPGVEGTHSMAALSKMASVGYNEGNLKWYELIPNEASLGGVQTRAARELLNQGCSFLSLYVYLHDHRAETLAQVVDTVEAFIKTNPGGEARFMLAAGSAGVDAATNIVVAKAMREMLLWVYGAVILLCYITFRSWRAVVCAVLPLAVTSILCEALMVGLDVGVKVATLPVIALGVGIGVDYALYVLSVVLARMKAGDSLSDAYHHALEFTGRMVLLTGATLALAVGTWVASPIKFQADMGILLAFMFVWNMVGALVLLPALAHFLMRQRAPAELQVMTGTVTAQV